MIADSAHLVLGPRPALGRLLSLLDDTLDLQGRSRLDIAVGAVCRIATSLGVTEDEEAERAASQCLHAVAGLAHDFGDPIQDIALTFPMTATAGKARDMLATRADPPVALMAVSPVPADQTWALHTAVRRLQVLPAGLQTQVCTALAEREHDPLTTMQLTRRWADATHDPVKSVASLAHHRALVRALNSSLLPAADGETATALLVEQAAIYGPDHEARRRAAWVGLLTTRQWSALEGVHERIGEAEPVAVSLSDPMRGPDMVLLQLLAECWEPLRAAVPNLATRLPGIRSSNGEDAAWDGLALVADRSSELASDLDRALTSKPGLLERDGVLARGTSPASAEAARTASSC